MGGDGDGDGDMDMLDEHFDQKEAGNAPLYLLNDSISNHLSLFCKEFLDLPDLGLDDDDGHHPHPKLPSDPGVMTYEEKMEKLLS